MKIDSKIKFSQLLLLLFLSMLFPFMLISGKLLAETGIWYITVWAVLSVLQIPLLYFVSNRVLMLKNSVSGLIIRVATLALFLLTGIRLTTMFSDFFAEMVNTHASKWFVAAVMLTASVYGVVRGIRGLSSSSIIFGALTVLMLILIVIGAVPEVKSNYVSAIFGNDGNLLDFVLLMISYNLILPLVLVLNAETGKPKTSAVIWVPIMLMAAEALIVFLTVACLGKYAFTQPYPIMSLFKAPNMNILESVSGVWFLTLTVLALMSVSVCLIGALEVVGNPRGVMVPIIFAVVVFAGYVLFDSTKTDINGKIWVYSAAALSIVSALLCIIKSKNKESETK